MRTRRIGSLEVSVVGIGTNNFGGRIDEARSAAVVSAALDAGINFFDTADVYGATASEEFLGRALGARRDEAVIATKFGAPVDEKRQGAKPDYVKRAAEDSLRRLGTDRIDLYQLHRPDASTPIADTLGALAELVAEGKVLEIGCSNFSVEQLREAASAIAPGAPAFASVQNDYSLLQREADQDVLPECERTGVAFLPFFPLFNGLLTGKYRRGETPPEGTRLGGAPAERQATVFSDRNFAIVEALADFAESHGHTLLEVRFAGLLAQSSIASVIAGATSPEQVKANAESSSWELSAEELATVDRLAPIGG